MAVKKGPMGQDMTMVSVTDDRLKLLERMRARLSQQIDVCADDRALVLLCTRLQSVIAEIAELAPLEESSPADMIAARRAARRRDGKPGGAIDHSATRAKKLHS